jgi:hypothetical protein
LKLDKRIYAHMNPPQSMLLVATMLEEVSEDVVLVKVGLQRHLRFLAES